MRRLLIIGLLSMTSCLLGCSDDSGGGDGGVRDGRVDGAGSDGADGGIDGPARDGLVCPSQILCGPAGTCCPVGDECVEGSCKPACASGVRCAGGAGGCCAVGEVCFGGQCTAPGSPCKDSFDCPENHFCEPTVDKCLPQPPGGPTCKVQPKTPKFAPKLEWSWTSSTIKPTYLQVINMPVVIDLDQPRDGVPEVIIVTSTGFSTTGNAFVRVLDGKTGKEKWPATAEAYMDGTGGDPDNMVGPRSTPAAADLDGDGTVEIVTAARAGGAIAFDRDGKVVWRSTRKDGTTPYVGSFASSTAAIADLDGDGKAEIVIGGVVFDHLGRLTSDDHIGRERCGANNAGYGPVSIIADVDGKSATTDQYVVCGNKAIRRDGTLLWDVSATLTDGYPAVADFDGDGKPELVVIGQGEVRVQDATTGVLLAKLTMPGTGQGGPPTVADFDADGKLEIASANGTSYNVFDYDAVTKQLKVSWSKPTQDGSSNVTGSSVFDFEGDGSAEVVYSDECYSRVYSGKDGTILWEVENSSATIHEYPVLVDVDGDNNTEYVVIANTNGSLCKAAGYKTRQGVFVYGDANDRWVRTRRVWNQHAYHVTNISVDGKVPTQEPLSWGPKGTNTYRVSTQGAGVFNAPDLAVDLEISTKGCPTALTLRARVKNLGSLGVPKGVEVAFYRGSDITGTALGTAMTKGPLLPGQTEMIEKQVDIVGQTPPFSFFVTVDGGSSSGLVGKVVECLENNNESGASGVRCWGID
jgi:hypothetical protein